MFGYKIGDTIQIENTWTKRSYGDGLPLSLPAIAVTLTPAVVRFAMQQGAVTAAPRKKRKRKTKG